MSVCDEKFERSEVIESTNCHSGKRYLSALRIIGRLRCRTIHKNHADFYSLPRQLPVDLVHDSARKAYVEAHSASLLTRQSLLSTRDTPHGCIQLNISSAWDPYTLENAFLSWAKIVDCGDAPLVRMLTITVWVARADMEARLGLITRLR